jgi:predicted dithiol-disulfide oxidoreductase (DUF899 family)
MKPHVSSGPASTSPTHAVVSREEWLRARTALLAREKEHTRQRDELARARLALPWVRLEKEYRFEGPHGAATLGELFRVRSQLIVYHFMLGPDWQEGCPSCSLICDHVDGALVHLEHRDVSFTAVSRAPFAQIAAFRARMGWRFPWVSSHGGDFNFDFGVSFTEEQLASGKMSYNFAEGPGWVEELPGISAFFRDADGSVYHTYSAFARGCEPPMGIYAWLDYAPKGRDEDGLAHTMAWVRHHDNYGPDYAVDRSAAYAPPAKASCGCE